MMMHVLAVLALTTAAPACPQPSTAPYIGHWIRIGEPSASIDIRPDVNSVRITSHDKNDKEADKAQQRGIMLADGRMVVECVEHCDWGEGLAAIISIDGAGNLTASGSGIKFRRG